MLHPSFTGSQDYSIPVSVSFSVGDTAGTVRRVELIVGDDQQVEGPETVHVVILNDASIMNPVTSGSQGGVAAVTLLDNDSETFA